MLTIALYAKSTNSIAFSKYILVAMTVKNVLEMEYIAIILGDMSF